MNWRRLRNETCEEAGIENLNFEAFIQEIARDQGLKAYIQAKIAAPLTNGG